MKRKFKFKKLLEKRGYKVSIQHFRYDHKGVLQNRVTIKWKRRQFANKGGVTVVTIISPEGKIRSGYALCTKDDIFDKKEGVDRSIFRIFYPLYHYPDSKLEYKNCLEAIKRTIKIRYNKTSL